ncbi:2'-5' RNA ligase family protein [Nonomuraea sp. NPDC059023]|uniref:2'-5' RNA ligase family protein n=1 Tax=unclassified Nonomuraea TaxID=2593643 RepID=UPI00369CFD69
MPERMADHWWWRPGVRPGRGLLVWHILIDDQPTVRALIHESQAKLAGLEGLDFIPAAWLHMTTQIIGFPDEITQAELAAMLTLAAENLQEIEPITVKLGEVLFHPEAVMLGIRPPRALHPVREAIRDAIAETVEHHQLDDSPGWTPHISVAYSNSERPTAPIVDALAIRPEPQSMTVRHAHLVLQQRDGHLYRWNVISSVPIGTGAGRSAPAQN